MFVVIRLGLVNCC